MAHRAPALVEHFFRHEYGRTVSTLVRTFGASRIELIEDSVQSAMVLALTSWSQRGIPDNPGAWLTRTARNAIIDQLRHERVVEKAADVIERDGPSRQPDPPSPDEIGDDQLRMLFVCCDEALKPETQLVLALKILCGFSVKEIALRLFTGEEAIRKRISRGRAQLRSLSPEMESPSRARQETRLEAVHRVIYLLFNEGYSSARPDQPIRRELCEEAVRLAMILCEQRLATRESWALLALMHFHHARIDARRDKDGGLLLMEEQDRRLWHRPTIREGIRCLMRAGNTEPLSRYHIEAAILLEHCGARTYQETNWAYIVSLYEALDRIYPSPLHTLNRAVAVAEWKGASEGLALLESLTPPAWLARYYLWDATLGELYRRTDRPDEARHHLERAKDGAPTEAERRRIGARLKDCGG